jgi:cellulose synthase/poly-beta-1,6-N-acetylglucosamine synthase-like glycosyltransferase
VILDADNEVENSFLADINQAYQNGFKVIQAHRVAKNYNTSTAILDAISEEINNSIFRRGHINAGLSSALIGSGIAFEINCFVKMIKNVTSVGEDKELELALHTENIFIQYLENVYVYDIKTDTNTGFYKQRQRWLSAQFQMLTIALKQISSVYKFVSWDYYDKLFQWTMLPRILAYMSILIFAVLTSFFFSALALKWWILFLIFSLAMVFSIPSKLYNMQLLKAIPCIPILCIMMFLNLFQLKKGSKKFIHTKHSKH